MLDGFIISDELRRYIQLVVNEHKTAFQPRPRKGRRTRRPPAPGSNNNDLRLVWGRVTAAVSADDTTFTIDHIQPLADGADPRTDTTDDSETLQIASRLNEALFEGEHITAAYSPDIDDDTDWILLVVERYRAIRGKWYSGTSTIVIDHIVALDSGLDPRSDPTSTSETVSVSKISGDNFVSGDDVWADWSVTNNRWEARPKITAGSVSKPYVCSLSGSVSAGSTSSVTLASGSTIYQINDDATLTSVSGKLYNPFSLSITPYSGELFTCAKFYQHTGSETTADDKYVLMGQEPRQRLASLSGFGAEKILDVPVGGSAPGDIKWEGAEC